MGKNQTRVENDRVVLRGAVCLVRKGRLADAGIPRGIHCFDCGTESVPEMDSASYRPDKCDSREVSVAPRDEVRNSEMGGTA